MFRRTLPVLIPLALTVSCTCSSTAGDGGGYRPEPWLEDLDALEAHMGLVYANLEWIVEHRGLDLPALDRRTRAAIRAAGSERAAHGALEEFVAAFDDPHFGIERRRPRLIGWLFRLGGDDQEVPGEDSPVFEPGASGREVCESFGYRDRDHGFEFDVGALPQWSALPSDGAFPAGVFVLPDDRRVGILRIEHFAENGYREACAAEWDAGSDDRTGACGEECLAAFRRSASDALARRVARRVAELEAAGARTLVVDVTGNGGGTEWVDPVTRIFSPNALRAIRVTTVRHRRGLRPTTDELAAVNAGLADLALPDSTRAVLGTARDRLSALLAELQTPCDRSPMWEGREPGCRQTIEAPSYTTGVFDWLPHGALEGYAGRADLYSPFGRDVPTGVWTGPLYLLVDRSSASATEAFVAMLKDNGAATVIGERTYGAGCGFLDGGLPLELPNSGLDVRMPDCSRFRINGMNEIEGVEPDVPLPWSDFGGSERARAVVEVLSRG
jgi:hypothetical protein